MPEAHSPQPDHPTRVVGSASRIVIADDDLIVRSALCRLLGDEFEIVGTARDAAEAIAVSERTRPDAALVDLEMPDGGGLRATREICRRLPATAVVMLSGDECAPVVLKAIEAGATAYVLKDAPYDELERTLRASISARPSLQQDAA